MENVPKNERLFYQVIDFMYLHQRRFLAVLQPNLVQFDVSLALLEEIDAVVAFIYQFGKYSNEVRQVFVVKQDAFQVFNLLQACVFQLFNVCVGIIHQPAHMARFAKPVSRHEKKSEQLATHFTTTAGFTLESGKSQEQPKMSIQPKLKTKAFKLLIRDISELNFINQVELLIFRILSNAVSLETLLLQKIQSSEQFQPQQSEQQQFQLLLQQLQQQHLELYLPSLMMLIHAQNSALLTLRKLSEENYNNEITNEENLSSVLSQPLISKIKEILNILIENCLFVIWVFREQFTTSSEVTEELPHQLQTFLNRYVEYLRIEPASNKLFQLIFKIFRQTK